MARALKENGLDEIRAFRARAIRQFSLGRISEEDYKFLVELADSGIERVETMNELGDEGQWL